MFMVDQSDSSVGKSVVSCLHSTWVWSCIPPGCHGPLGCISKYRAEIIPEQHQIWPQNKQNKTSTRNGDCDNIILISTFSWASEFSTEKNDYLIQIIIVFYEYFINSFWWPLIQTRGFCSINLYSYSIIFWFFIFMLDNSKHSHFFPWNIFQLSQHYG